LRDSVSSEQIGLKIFDVELNRHLPTDGLLSLSDEEADAAEADGALAGNRRYRDMRAMSWDELRGAIDAEARAINRIESAQRPAQEEEAFLEEREEMDDDVEELWGLDVGVASATVALSALGAAPVASCNAGAFGGYHLASRPQIIFYLDRARAEAIIELAEMAEVGVVVEEGMVVLFGRSVADIHTFACAALRRYGPRGAS
jgi:hypothetical protein